MQKPRFLGAIPGKWASDAKRISRNWRKPVRKDEGLALNSVTMQAK